MINKSELPVIKGSHYTSSFYVIGRAKGLVLGFRAWVEDSPHGTEIMFRIRIVADQDSPHKILNFENYIKEAFPGYEWTMATKEHVSLTGAIRVNVRHPDSVILKDLLVKHNAINNTYDLIREKLSFFELSYSYEEFEEFFLGEILDKVPAPLPTGGGAVVVSFGDFKSTTEKPLKKSKKEGPNQDVLCTNLGIGSGDGSGGGASNPPKSCSTDNATSVVDLKHE